MAATLLLQISQFNLNQFNSMSIYKHAGLIPQVLF